MRTISPQPDTDGMVNSDVVAADRVLRDLMPFANQIESAGVEVHQQRVNSPASVAA